jgi:FimV-like protein
MPAKRGLLQAGRRRIGPIRQHAQLWPIAADLREAFRATTEQLMVGLFEANPGSFCHRNLHCLKAAAYLEVPQATRVAAIRPRMHTERCSVISRPGAMAAAAMGTLRTPHHERSSCASHRFC